MGENNPYFPQMRYHIHETKGDTKKDIQSSWKLKTCIRAEKLNRRDRKVKLSTSL